LKNSRDHDGVRVNWSDQERPRLDLERLNQVGANPDRVSVTAVTHEQVTDILSVNSPTTQSNYRLFLDDAPITEVPARKNQLQIKLCIDKKLIKSMKFYGSPGEIQLIVGYHVFQDIGMNKQMVQKMAENTIMGCCM